MFFATQLIGFGAASDSAAYAGPGDIVSGALAWCGLRAYSAAAIGSNCVRLVRASDSAQQDFVTLADGTLDVASIATFLAATTGKVVTLYDQTGNGKDVTQATDANRPVFALNVIGSRPAMQFLRASSTELRSSGSVATGSQPWTFSLVARRTGDTNNYGMALSVDPGASTVAMGYTDSVNTGTLYAGSHGTTTVSDAATHSLIGEANGASSDLCVDGASNTVSSGTGAPTGPFAFGTDGYGTLVTANIFEGGVWSGAFSAGNKTAMAANQAAYWGY
jgi:hypothetical protein